MVTFLSPIGLEVLAKSRSVCCTVTGQGEPCVSFQMSSTIRLSRRYEKFIIARSYLDLSYIHSYVCGVNTYIKSYEGPYLAIQ